VTISSFEDILSWQKAKDLAIDVYSDFKTNKDYGFKDQIQRAVISVSNNIAEGFERRGDKEFKHFLFIAKGSCGEVRSMLYVALGLGYINEKTFRNYTERTIEISRLLSGLIKSLSS